MIHTKRVFGVQKIPDIKTLANQLFHYTWTGCTGYQLGDYLFLNDSFSPDGAQEFAVHRISDDKFFQIESITIVNWSFSEKYLEELLSKAMESRLIIGSYELQLEDAELHRCHLCT
jgi:hypothetical protein